jgi:uncharacterized protein YbjT (DUF2867 family)
VAGRALVTGATGFIGNRLAGALAERGWEVRCLVRDRGRADVVTDVSGAELFGVEPMPFAEALRRSLAEADATR